MRTFLIGLGCFVLGMGAMWAIEHVDFRFHDGAESPDELARAAFEAMRNNDFASFEKHVPDEDDIQTLLDHIREHATRSKVERTEKRLERDGGLSGVAEKHMDANRRRFGVTMERTREAGLDWRQAEYLGVDEERTRLSERWGITGGDVRFRVRSGDRIYEFKLDNCAAPGGVWTCGSGIHFYVDEEPPMAADRPEPARTERAAEEAVSLPEPVDVRPAEPAPRPGGPDRGK